MKIKEFIPPILINKLRKLKYGGHKLFDSYETALAECRNGYEEDALVKVVCKKTELYQKKLFTEHPLILDNISLRILVALDLARSRNDLNIIDYGGACGHHYFLSKFLLSDRVRLRWAVVETPQMAKIGQTLEDGHLKFYDNVQKARDSFDKIDLVFASGALQYAPRPYEALKNLTTCRASNIFITRLGLTTASSELITTQKSKLSLNGPGPMPEGIPDAAVQYPVTFVRKDIFEQVLSEHYEIKFQLNEDKNAYSAGKYSVDMFGFFGSLKTAGK